MTIRAEYQESPEAESQSWLMDYDSKTVGEVMELERLSGKALRQFESSVNAGGQTDLLILLYVTRKRDEPGLTFATFRDTPFDRFTFVNVEVEAAVQRALDAGAAPEELAEMDAQTLLAAWGEDGTEGKADRSDEEPEQPSA